MASVLSRIQVIMEANTANYNNELRKARKNSKSAFSDIGKAAGKMALGVGVAVAAMGAKTLQTAGNFEEAMGAISAVSGATGKDFDDLRERAKQLGSETAYSATEAANGMEFLAKAGLNTQQVLKTIPNALALASAGSIDLAMSADILSNIMSGMGIAADESGRAADVLAKAAASANVDVEMLGESMKYVAPIAKQLGMSLEETTAIIGVMGNAGIQASQAGTSMRAMFTRFNTHQKANAAFMELGVSLKDANGDMRSMIDVMSDLSVATDGLKADEKLAYFKDMAGVEAMSALAVAVDAAADGSLQNLKEKLDGAKGAAAEMAAIRMEGLNGSIKSLVSAWEGLQIAIADSGLLELATGAITVVADKMRGLSSALPEVIANMTAFFQSAEVAGAITSTIDGLKMAWDNLKSVIKRTGEIIAPVIGFFIEHEELSKSLAIAIGIVGGAVLIYNTAIVIGAAATVAFTAAFALLTSPITLTIVAITALVAVGVYLYRNWDEIKAKATEIWGSITSYIGGKIDAIKGYFSSSFPAMTAIVGGALKAMWAVVSAQFNLIKTVISTALNVVKAIFKGDFAAIPGIIGNGLKAAAGIVGNMMGNILNVIKNTGAKLYQIGKDIINGLINGIKDRASAAVNAVKDTASGMYQGVKNFFVVRSPSRLMRELGVNIVDGLIIGIKDKKSEAYKAAVSVANSVLEGIESTRKSIALFGNDSAVAAFDYDVLIGKYDDIAPILREKYRADLIKLENMKAEEEKRARITSALKSRAAQFQTDQTSAADAFGGLEVNGPQTEAEKLQLAYQNKMAIVDRFEQMHTDKTAQAEAARLALTENYNQSIKDLEMQRQAANLGSITALFGMALGETSKGYKGMFLIQKAYDFASAQSASFTAIAKAWSSAPFPANLPAVGMTTLQTGIIPAAIQALNPKGFMKGGYTGNYPTDMPIGPAHGKEFVAHADATRKYRPELEAMNNGTYDRGNNKAGPVVYITIEDHAGVPVSKRVDDDGRIRVIVGEELNKQLPNHINDPYSATTRALKANYHLQRDL